jgi:hypothetical protein
MDKLDHYRACIQALLEQYAQVGTRNEAVENELFFDTVRDHYQLMRVGWNGLSRVYHTVLHFDIKGGQNLAPTKHDGCGCWAGVDRCGYSQRGYCARAASCVQASIYGVRGGLIAAVSEDPQG